MRETDTRMAKYSGRGLIINVFTYLLCLVIGEIHVVAPVTTVVLTCGLIIATLVRGYILVRFESLYASGPSRWRTFFFIATLLGAAWWSIILVVFTLTLGMTAETPYLWVYTIIFFATTVHVTSPFRLFSQTYLVLTLLPPTLAALYVGGVPGYMYSLMMLIFIAMLFQMVQVLSRGYWERFEANYALKQKAIALEVEKRDVNASVDLSTQFLNSLGHEFRTSLNDILGGLTLLTDSELESHQQELLKLAQKAGERQLDLVNNVVDFSRINNRQLVLDHSVFNLRSQLELWITDLAVNAHQQSVEVDYDMDPAVPLRVNGDAKRIGQIFKYLFNNAIQFSEQGSIFVDIDFKRDNDQGGMLEVIIIDCLKEERPPIETTETEPKFESSRTKGLWFTICKGLTECMDGGVDIDCSPGKETHYRLRIPLKAAEQQLVKVTSNPKLRDKRVLVIAEGLPLGAALKSEMQDWGLLVNEVSGFDSAEAELLDLEPASDPYDLIINVVWQDAEKALAFSRRVLNAHLEQPIPQIFSLSHNHSNDAGVRQFIEEQPSLNYLYRPLVPQILHDLIAHSLLGKPMTGGKGGEPESDDVGDCKILLVDDHRVNQMVAEGMLKKMGYRVHLAGNGLEALEEIKGGDIDLVLMDCQMPEMDGFEATRRIRKIEDESGNDGHIPIIAMTAHTEDGDQSQCLACGMDDYLAKPVQYETLQTHLIRWLGKSH
ncbi:hypothetical protein GCM10027217_33060 [Pseudomaricurvus hydrocarbonicus]